MSGSIYTINKNRGQSPIRHGTYFLPFLIQHEKPKQILGLYHLKVTALTLTFKKPAIFRAFW